MSRYAKFGKVSRRVGSPDSKYAYRPEQLEVDIQKTRERVEAASESFKQALDIWEKEHIKLSRDQRKRNTLSYQGISGKG